MHVYFGLAFGVFLAYLVKTFGFRSAFYGTLMGLSTSGLIILLAVLTFELYY